MITFIFYPGIQSVTINHIQSESGFLNSWVSEVWLQWLHQEIQKCWKQYSGVGCNASCVETQVCNISIIRFN